MPYGAILIFLIGLPMLLSAFTTFDQILKLEYSHHRSDWDKDGKPRGFFWSAPESDYVMSDLAKQVLCFKWLFSTPAWALDSAEYRKSFTRFRNLVLGWNILVAAVAIIFICSGPEHARHFLFGSLMR